MSNKELFIKSGDGYFPLPGEYNKYLELVFAEKKSMANRAVNKIELSDNDINTLEKIVKRVFTKSPHCKEVELNLGFDISGTAWIITAKGSASLSLKYERPKL